MFLKNEDSKPEGKEKKNEEGRGAKDEFESLVLIVKEDKILLQKVLDKIRVHREFSSKSSLDVAKQQHDTKEQIRRNK